MTLEERQSIEGRSLLLFDGLCAMCNGLVRFLIRRDAAGHLVYAPLESTLGREMLAQIGPGWNPDGIVLIESALTTRQSVSAKSDAAICILRLLSGVWPWLGRLLSCVPRSLREWVYRCVARWRYRLFGTHNSCPIPSTRERAVILGIAAGQGD